MAAAGAEIKQRLCAVSTGILPCADRQTDRQTAMLPDQTGVFSPTLRRAEGPRLLGFPSVALQEHPAGASLRSIPQEHPAGASRSVAMEMRLRRSASAIPLQYPVAALPSSWLPWEIKEILGLH